MNHLISELIQLTDILNEKKLYLEMYSQQKQMFKNKDILSIICPEKS